MCQTECIWISIKNPFAFKIMIESLYIDDGLAGADSIEEVIGLTSSCKTSSTKLYFTSQMEFKHMHGS